jgi:hypothetical protein
MNSMDGYPNGRYYTTGMANLKKEEYPLEKKN